MVQLMSELNLGFNSGDEQGWISASDTRDHFRKKRERMHEINE